MLKQFNKKLNKYSKRYSKRYFSSKIFALFLVWAAILSVTFLQNLYAAQTPDIDVVFVIDNSGSMNSSDKEKNALAGAHYLIKWLDNSNSRAGYVMFSDVIRETRELEPVSGNSGLLSAIDDTTYPQNGGTDIGLALETAYDIMFSNGADSNSKKLVILLSDGNPDVSGKTQDDLLSSIDNSVLKFAEKNVPIYTIGLNSDDTLNTELLKKNIAEKTGGNFYEAKKNTELVDKFIDITNVLAVSEPIVTNSTIQSLPETETTTDPPVTAKIPPSSILNKPSNTFNGEPNFLLFAIFAALFVGAAIVGIFVFPKVFSGKLLSLNPLVSSLFALGANVALCVSMWFLFNDVLSVRILETANAKNLFFDKPFERIYKNYFLITSVFLGFMYNLVLGYALPGLTSPMLNVKKKQFFFGVTFSLIGLVFPLYMMFVVKLSFEAFMLYFLPYVFAFPVNFVVCSLCIRFSYSRHFRFLA